MPGLMDSGMVRIVHLDLPFSPISQAAGFDQPKACPPISNTLVVLALDLFMNDSVGLLEAEAVLIHHFVYKPAQDLVDVEINIWI
jgi:hypothetical protein